MVLPPAGTAIRRAAVGADLRESAVHAFLLAPSAREGCRAPPTQVVDPPRLSWVLAPTTSIPRRHLLGCQTIRPGWREMGFQGFLHPPTPAVAGGWCRSSRSSASLSGCA